MAWGGKLREFRRSVRNPSRFFKRRSALQNRARPVCTPCVKLQQAIFAHTSLRYAGLRATFIRRKAPYSRAPANLLLSATDAVPAVPLRFRCGTAASLWPCAVPDSAQALRGPAARSEALVAFERDARAALPERARSRQDLGGSTRRHTRDDVAGPRTPTHRRTPLPHATSLPLVAPRRPHPRQPWPPSNPASRT